VNKLALVAGATCAILISVPACGIRGLDFVKDERVEIVAPKDDAQVTLPMTVRWKATDFAVTGPTDAATNDAGYFGVFVDRAPPGPGSTLASLAEGDEVCKATPGCPDEKYLASQRAYTTTDTSFRIERLPELTRDRTREGHEVTIVLLDGAGRRIGESAFRVEFQIRRKVRR
jgi:hypothetical protein